MLIVTSVPPPSAFFQRQRAAVHGDDLLAHGKADAAAAGFGAALVKFELDAGKLFFRDAGAVVPDADDDEAVFMRDGGVDALALAAVLAALSRMLRNTCRIRATSQGISGMSSSQPS